ASRKHNNANTLSRLHDLENEIEVKILDTAQAKEAKNEMKVAQQELLRRRIYKKLDVNMKTRQKINLELYEVVNFISEIESEEKQQEKEVQVCMVNTIYQPSISPIPEVAMSQNSSNKEGPSDTDQPTVYHLEFITLPLVASNPTDLITLQQWVAESTRESGLDPGEAKVEYKNEEEKYSEQ
ncbi:5702_t:CDS:2, partial [Dentiscutata erythropus]